MWILIGLVVVIVLLVLWGIVLYNRLVQANVAVDEGFAQIEVQLKRRSDLIPNLVNTVKGYAAHESSTFEAVTEARAIGEHATTVPEVAAADGMLTQALRGLLAVAEAYPDLKASQNFLSLQEELSATENKIAFSRQYYNDAVRTLNTLIVSIPTKFFVGTAGVKARDFYEVPDAVDRNAPTVTF
ncbi:MAG: LemA family protein [Actinomycetota bacterium]|nr:LemA family protein [Actinomycetota bacterium]MDP2286956.1 LemA family protein [Actinomycetota bacterium]